MDLGVRVASKKYKPTVNNGARARSCLMASVLKYHQKSRAFNERPLYLGALGCFVNRGPKNHETSNCDVSLVLHLLATGKSSVLSSKNGSFSIAMLNNQRIDFQQGFISIV